MQKPHESGQTIALARDLFDYQPETGFLTWKRGRAHLVGKVAGRLDTYGYRQVSVGGIRVLAHRLVFAMQCGRWPLGTIDHINGVRDDNRLLNLRECTHAENVQNHVRSAAGRLPGCHFRASTGKWTASVRVSGRRIHIGCFPDELAAHQAYMREKARHHPFFNQCRISDKGGAAP